MRATEYAWILTARHTLSEPLARPISRQSLRVGSRAQESEGELLYPQTVAAAGVRVLCFPTAGLLSPSWLIPPPRLRRFTSPGGGEQCKRVWMGVKLFPS